MKTITTLFLMLFAVVAVGQTKPVKPDTVKCVMVYIDMAIFTNHPDQNIVTQTTVAVGYSIKKSNSIYVQYLDFYKRPLSKSIYVIFSKDMPK